jgi:hypothetical protein
LLSTNGFIVQKPHQIPDMHRFVFEGSGRPPPRSLSVETATHARSGRIHLPVMFGGLSLTEILGLVGLGWIICMGCWGCIT